MPGVGQFGPGVYGVEAASMRFYRKHAARLTRAEAATPAARPVHVQAGPSASMGGLGDVVGATATSPDPDSVSVIERDPNVNRSLMLRLIAGVRGL